MAVSSYLNVVQNFYIAYFGRPADPAGLSAAAASLDATSAPTTAQGLLNVYSTNAAVKALVDGFGNSLESANLYGGSTTTQKVTAIYVNLLNRAPDVAGLTYWVNEIESGRLPFAKVALAIAAAAETNGGADGAVVTAKIAAAAGFVALLDTSTELNAYAGDVAAAQARALISQVPGISGTALTNATTQTIADIVNKAPVALADTNAASEGGALISGSVATNDSDANNSATVIRDVQTYTAVGSVPAGLTFNSNGSYSFDPTVAAYNGLKAGQVQNVVLNYTVSDGKGGSAASTLTIAVTGTNDAPTANPAGITTAEDTPVSGNLVATDPDGDALTYSVTTPAANGTLTVNAATGAYTYTPNANFNGTDSFTYRVADASGATSSATVNLTVTSVNDAPVAQNGTLAVAEGSALVTGNVVATDVDAGSVLVFTLNGAAPAGLSFQSNGAYTFDAGNAAYNSLAQGQTQQITVPYTVTDNGGLTSTANLVITVTGTNDAPVAQNDAAATTQDMAVTFNVLANDSDPDQGAVLSVASATVSAVQGSVAIGAGGNITFTPAPGFFGNATITYITQDQFGAQSTATASVAVQQVNFALTAGIDSVEGTAANDTILANDATLNPGDSIDGGAGTGDTLIYAASNSANLSGLQVAGVERLVVTQDAGGTATFDLSGVTGLTTLVDTNSTGDVFFNQITGIPSVGLQLDNLTGPGTDVGVSFQDSVVAGGADALNVALQSNQNIGTLSIGRTGSFNSGVETVNLASGGTSSNTITTLDTNLTTLNISGAQNLTIANALNTTVRTINASAAGGNINLSFANNTVGATYLGSSGSDVVVGGSGNDNISGNDGNDNLNAGEGNNIVNGGAGNDILAAGNGANLVNGGAGVDSITVGNGNNTIDGGDDGDVVNAGNGANVISGGAGNDSLTAGNGGNNIDGGVGNDAIVSGSGTDTLAGGDGNDVITTGAGGFRSGSTTVYEVVNGGVGDDTVNVTGQGVRQIDLGAGNDTLNMATNRLNGSIVTGGAGTDVVNANGVDVVSGADNLGGLSNPSGFDGASSGVEQIRFTTATQGAIDGLNQGTNSAFTGNINTGNATGGIFTFNNNLTADVALTRINNNTTVNFNNNGTALNNSNVTVSNVQNDGVEVVTLNVNSSGALGASTEQINVLTVTGNETVNLNAVSQGGAVDNLVVASLVADETRLLNITGNDNVSINAFTAGSIATIDGSTATGNLSLNGASFTQNVTVLGGSGADSLTTGSGNDSLVGAIGNDTLNAGTGVDTVVGGEGNDVFQFTDASLTAADSVVGGNGADRVAITGGGVNLADNIFFRWSSVETLDVSGTGTNNQVSMGAIADTAGLTAVVGSNQNDTIITQEGFDNDLTVTLGAGNDFIDLGQYYDNAGVPTGVAQQSRVTINAIDANVTAADFVSGVTGSGDIINLTSSNGTANFAGFAGFDRLNITGGNGTTVNFVDGNVANGQTFVVDSTQNGFGNVNFNGGAETDGRFSITAGSGNDTLVGGALNDTINGGDGNDVINGGAGNDSLNGGNGNDFIVGGTASGDNIDGGAGSDTIVGGGAGGDTIQVGAGDGSSDRVFIDVPSITGLPAISNINGWGTNDILRVNAILTSGNQGITAVNRAQGEPINAGTDRLVKITTTAPAGISDAGLAGNVLVASFLQTNALGSFAVGERAIIALSNGTNTYVYLYTSDGSPNTNATEFTQIAVLNGYTDTAALQLQSDYQYTPFDDVGFVAPGTTVDGLAGNDLVYLTGTGTVGFTNVESIVGTAGNDTFNSLSSTPTNVSVYGNGGADTFNMGVGQTFTLFSNGTVNGAGGSETIVLSGIAPGGLPAGVTTAGGPHNLIVNNVEVIDGSGSNGNDTITSNNVGANVAINLGAGNDTLSLGNGSQTVTVTNVDVVNGGNGGSNTVNVTDNTALAVNGGTSTIVVNLNNNDGFGQTVTTVNVDTVNGSADNDTINAGGNVDAITVNGNAGNDVITGGAGADSITTGNGADFVAGGAGNDIINGAGTGAKNLDGGDDNDSITGGSDADTISGGQGTDTINAGAGNDIINGGTGNDTVTADLTVDGADSVDLGSELDDRVTITGAPANQIRVTFTSGDVGDGAALDGNNAANEDGGLAVRLQAEDGADGLTGPVSRYDDEGITFVAPAGVTFDVRNLTAGEQRGDQFNRVVLGTSAADTLDFSAQSINYYVNAGAGNDVVTGGSGNDFLVGNGGSDTLNGGNGMDTIFGVATGDVISGGNGIDTANLAAGGVQVSISDIESVVGGAGNDTINFTASIVATIDGAGGNDVVNGSANADDHTVVAVETVNAGAGNDIIRLTNVANTIAVNGGTENDILLGGNQNDSVSLTGIESVDVGDGADTVRANDTTAVVADLGLGDDLFDLLDGPLDVGGALSGAATVNGNGGNDTVLGSFTNDTVTLTSIETVDVSDGNDLVTFVTQATATVTGGNGNDTVVLSDADDVLVVVGVETVNAAGGNDTINAAGNGVAITVLAGTGNESITGSGANDTFVFAAGTSLTSADTLAGGLGTDTVQIGYTSGAVDLTNVSAVETLALTGASYSGTITLSVAESAVSIVGSAGNDVVTLAGVAANGLTFNGGTGGLDRLTLGAVNGNIVNVINADTVVDNSGFVGNDSVNASGSTDSVALFSFSGNDTLIGGAASDRFTLRGGDGNDSVNGGSGGAFDVLNINGNESSNITLLNVTNGIEVVNLRNEDFSSINLTTNGYAGLIQTGYINQDIGASPFNPGAFLNTVGAISTTFVDAANGLTIEGFVANHAASTVSFGNFVNTATLRGVEIVNGGNTTDNITITNSLGVTDIAGLVGTNGGVSDSTIRAGAGNDNITLTGATGSQTLVFEDIATNGTDTITGFHAGASGGGVAGDVFNFSSFFQGGLSFDPSVGLANPGATTDIANLIIRLVDQPAGDNISTAVGLQAAFNGGEYDNYDLINANAVVITASNTGTNVVNVFEIHGDGAGLVDAITLVGQVTLDAGQTIGSFTAANFA